MGPHATHAARRKNAGRFATDGRQLDTDKSRMACFPSVSILPSSVAKPPAFEFEIETMRHYAPFCAMGSRIECGVTTEALRARRRKMVSAGLRIANCKLQILLNSSESSVSPWLILYFPARQCNTACNRKQRVARTGERGELVSSAAAGRCGSVIWAPMQQMQQNEQFRLPKP
jgi:hypothetical protein